MIRLNVFIRTTESNRDELVTIARELTAASLRDEGCVAYDLYESATRRDVLLIAKPGRTKRPSQRTARQPHFTVLVPRLRELGEMKTEKFVF